MRRVVLLVVAAGLTTLLGASAAPAIGPARGAPPERDSFGVGRRVLELEDSSRSTPADPKAQRDPIPASDTRALPTTIFYPSTGPVVEVEDREPGEPRVDLAVDDAPPAKGRFPVILFSHGAPGAPKDYQPMLERWAGEGYVVVAPIYPVTSTGGPTKVGWADQRDQARDARFVLGEVLELDRVHWRDGGLGRRLDRSRVAAAGHSMGGLTTLALVSDCCRDRRIDAAVVLAGVSDPMAGPRITEPQGPILFAHATRDFAVPFAQGEDAYAAATLPKFLLEIGLPVVGILPHVLPFSERSGPTGQGVAAVVDDFLAATLGDDPAALAAMAATAAAGEYLTLHSDPAIP